MQEYSHIWATSTCMLLNYAHCDLENSPSEIAYVIHYISYCYKLGKK